MDRLISGIQNLFESCYELGHIVVVRTRKVVKVVQGDPEQVDFLAGEVDLDLVGKDRKSVV